MKYTIQIVFILIVISTSAQKPSEIDSLKNKLVHEVDEDVRMRIYGDLAKKHIYINPIIAGKYNDSMAILADKLNLEEYKIKSIYNSSVVEATLGNFQKSIELINQVIPYYWDVNDSLSLTQAYYQIGASQIRLDNNEEAIKSLNRALNISEATQNDKMTAAVLNATAVIYKQTYQTDKALEYFNRAIAVCTRGKDTSSLAIVYNGAGVLYLHSDSLDKAMDYFQNAMLFSKKTNNVSGISYQHRNIGMVYQKLGQFSKARESHLKALEIRKTLGQKLNIGGSYSDLGEVNMSMENYNVAEDYFQKAVEIFKEIEALSSEIFIYEQLSRLYKLQGHPQKALDNLEKYYEIRDSLKNNELREKINDIEIKYESEKKEKELILKEKELAVKDIAIAQSKKRKNLYGLMTILFILTSILLWYAYSQSRRRKNQEILTLKRDHQIKSLESLLEGEEKERSRIAIELHDGVNGDLSALKYKLSALAETNNKVINEALKMIDNSCEQVRAISHNLTPPSFDKFTLMEILENYCHSLDDSQNDVAISFAQIGNYIKMSKKEEIAVFRIIQELIINSLKHADATEITVQTSYINQQLQITVEDNGKGFAPNNMGDNNGIGLRNVNSRVDFLGAKMDFSSNQKGTSYVLEIDLENHDNN